MLTHQAINKDSPYSLNVSSNSHQAELTMKLQKKVELIFYTAIKKAEQVGSIKNMRTKCETFYDALKHGGQQLGLYGSWFAEVTHDNKGNNQWCMISNIDHHGLKDNNDGSCGLDGCIYYSAYCHDE